MNDELRRLDEELAAGRLDADSYRRRRDELIAARLPDPPSVSRAIASSPADPVSADPVPAARSPADGPSAAAPPADAELDDAELDDAERELDLAPEQRPPPPPPDIPADIPAGADVRAGSDDPGPTAARDPFPPPFRWGEDTATGSGDMSPDSTQVVAASLARAVEVTPDRTQVVLNGPGPSPGPAAVSPVNGGRGTPTDPTQVVGRSRVRGLDPRLAGAGPQRSRPLAPRAAPVPPERTQFVPATALARAGDRRSVPARATVPPWADGRSTSPPDARRQGREVFTHGTGPSAATIAGTAAVVLVVAVVLVLSFLLT